ncbi:MAG TPA: glycosyltransferase family 39 protein [Terriglobia bacterium]|nr:glycosyltransferase family 39 protein [Terriglobia bacterium]
MSNRPDADSTPLQPNPILPVGAAISVWAVVLTVAFGSLHFFYTRGLTQLYGDTLAHMAGARRLFDSMTPGRAEIGNVWLPMFHFLAAPLAINDHLWRTGLAGSLVATMAFAISAWFLFRLSLEMNRSIAAGLVTLGAFLLCPSMFYLASTPMTEPLSILWVVLAVYALFRYQTSGLARWLAVSGVAAFFGTLTRYSVWYLLPFAALFVLLVRKDAWRVRLRRAVLFSVIAGAGPALWMLHDAVTAGNPIEFYNGPDSAQAIYAHQVATTAFRYPTDGSMLISARYYVEDLRLILGPWLLVLAALGLMLWVLERRYRKRRAACLLLLVLLPFYVQAMAGAAVPLYVPAYFPHSYYNLRYGIEMLPGIALLASFVISPTVTRSLRRGILAVCLAILGAQSAWMLAGGARNLPMVTEGILNSPCKTEPDQTLIAFFRSHYDGKRILMQSGEWPCLAPTLDIHYRNILSGNNRRYWRKLPDGAGKFVEWIVSGENDPVDVLMRAYPEAFKDFVPVYRRNFPEQQSITIYRRKSGSFTAERNSS